MNNNPLNILYASSEAFPLIKTGGLADVAGSLPLALNQLGQDARLILPAYPGLRDRINARPVGRHLNLPGSAEPVEILQGDLPGLMVYLVNCPRYFGRHGHPYLDPDGIDWPDNADRFALFGRAISAIALGHAGLDWQPDILHGNDWQTGLGLALTRRTAPRPGMLFTIHNLAYRGIFEGSTFHRLQLPPDLWHPEALEFHHQLCFIKGGLAFSDRVNTVSPTYAREVLDPENGYGLNGLLRYLGPRFSGVINGIDYHAWNPATDAHIPHHFDADSFHLKVQNKLALQQELGLPVNDKAFMVAHIGRLVDQKGVDLILKILPGMLEDSDTQLLVLGSGEYALEHGLQQAQQWFPQQVAVHLGYNEPLAHRIEAASDLFLMPSRFEPCGLNQLYSLRYGTVPVVHRTGGLADTVVDATIANFRKGKATGFVFKHPDGHGLWYAINQAKELWRHDPAAWEQLAVTGMRRDFSWQSSAQNYLRLYQEALDDLTAS